MLHLVKRYDRVLHLCLSKKCQHRLIFFTSTSHYFYTGNTVQTSWDLGPVYFNTQTLCAQSITSSHCSE